MDARLNNGTVVELAQDCDCRSHEGPHWLAVDRFDREQNEALRRRAGHSVALLHRYAESELARLTEKRRQLLRHGIEALLP